MIRRLIVTAFFAGAALSLIAAPATPRKEGASKPPKPWHVSKGEPVQLTDYLIPGKTTIFDFYSEYCGPCVQVAPLLEQLHQKRADVVVVKVDINRPGRKGIDWASPVAKQFGLNSIPHFKIYGPDGKLLAEDGPDGPKARVIVGGLLD